MKWLLPRRNTLLETCAAYRHPKGLERFDEATGQIYTETIAAIQTSDDRNWARSGRLVSVKGSSYRDAVLCSDHAKAAEWGMAGEGLGACHEYVDEVKKSRAKGLKGARSLQDAAIECILENISDITLEGVECLPNQIVRQVWYAVNKRCTMCFNTWRIFSKILRECEMPTLELFRYRQVITAPESPLPTYTTILTSASFDFLTSLCITTAFPLPEILKLTKITNLGALEIIHTDGILRNPYGPKRLTHGIGDRIIKAWEAAVFEHGAFRALRILKLWNLEEVTHNSLLHVNSFPALAVYDARGCRFGPETVIQATMLGWKILDTNILDELDHQCNAQAISMQNHKVSRVRPPRRAPSQPLWDTSKVQRVSRAEIPHFLARDENQQRPLAFLPDLALPAEAVSESRRSKKQFRGQRFQTTPEAPKTWDFPTCTIFTRLGELRNDMDLSQAGVNIGDQAVVGHELVNSVPMASLCLGPAPSTFSTILRGFTFLRVQIPPRTDSKTNLRSPDLSMQSGPSGRSRAGNFQNRHQRPSMMRAKKRKLDDVLGSFL